MKPVNAKVYDWDNLFVGMKACLSFVISEEDMQIFEKISGDRSRIHKNKAFANINNFREPLVYGALTVAKISQMLGMYLPGDLGLATSWKINFHNPLYVNEEALIIAQIKQISVSTRTIIVKFKVSSTENNDFCKSGKLIASGIAGSQILQESS